MAKTFTDKDAATLRRLDRKISSGTAKRADVLRAFDLQQKKKAARDATPVVSA